MDDHLSRPGVTARAQAVVRDATGRRVCLYADLAPGGVTSRTSRQAAVSLLPRLSSLTSRKRWRCISVALSWSSPPPAVNRHPCPMVLGLSSYPQGARDRLVTSQNVSYPFAREMSRGLPNGRNIVHRWQASVGSLPCHGPLLCPQCKHRMTGPLPPQCGASRAWENTASGSTGPGHSTSGKKQARDCSCPPGPCQSHFFRQLFPLRLFDMLTRPRLPSGHK